MAQALGAEMVTTSGGERLIAIRQIYRIVEEKGGDDTMARLVKQAYHSLDHLVGELYNLKAQSQKLETRLQESEATARTKDKVIRTELENQEKIHQ